jgi:hypothetical protein
MKNRKTEVALNNVKEGRKYFDLYEMGEQVCTMVSSNEDKRHFVNEES